MKLFFFAIVLLCLLFSSSSSFARKASPDVADEGAKPAITSDSKQAQQKDQDALKESKEATKEQLKEKGVALEEKSKESAAAKGNGEKEEAKGDSSKAGDSKKGGESDKAKDSKGPAKDGDVKTSDLKKDAKDKDSKEKGDVSEKGAGKGKSGAAEKGKKPRVPSKEERRLWPSLDSLITSPFGVSRAINGGGMHTGMDVRAHLGWPVRAIRAGRVSFCGWRGNAGIAVMVAQKDGRVATYAHLSQVLVKAGDKVEKGDHVGLVGCTGRTTGAHLHLSLKEGEHLVNPRAYVDEAYELFDPPLSELKGGIDAQSCSGAIMYGSGPANGGYKFVPGRGYGDLYRMRGISRRNVNPRLRGVQNYLRMRKALKGLKLEYKDEALRY